MDTADGSASSTRKRGDPRYSPPTKDSPEAKGVRFAPLFSLEGCCLYAL